MIKVKIVVLVCAMVLTAVVVSTAGRATDAYFSDTKSGAMTGTLGQWGPVCTLEPGSSKARHFDGPDSKSPQVLPIAQRAADGSLYLDFGDEAPGNGNSSPDVLRMGSLTPDPQRVLFSVSGAIAPFVSVVRFDDATPSILEASAVESVFIELAIPEGTTPGVYAGFVHVSVAGREVAVLPATLTVRALGKQPKPESAAESVETGAPSPTASPAGTTAVATPLATPMSTPLATPTPGPSASTASDPPPP